MYHQLAHLYDWPGALEFARKITDKDLQILSEFGIQPGAHLLDLGCGTGTLALSLAQKGYQVTGIDLSAAMLAQAQAKQAEYPEPMTVRWVQGDMRDFVLEAPVNAVLCHYDSLNHLSNETELRCAFLQVAQALQPDGLFLFDLNTLENYQTFWNGKDSYEGPNYRLKTVSHFQEASGKAEVQFTVDEYNDAGELHHHEETVFEQYFNEKAVEKYLMAADFCEISYAPFNPVEDLPADFPLKTFWVCKKRPV
ncbi:class I SAM-dependent DNA methyltransferase [Vampirovibrio chlorellavorus]|uniref:class I SAM-dependent DNA methyltransferase n=1 Tax=Vampirovibrio chlorellavorus TaxID=758823 RepID=UPI0026EF6978|nr:class I SAM-dependent methyltransferase [Vampirovibrio chlorellavorus]